MIVHADCLEEMARMDAESVAAVVTDPPYGLGFMGKVWDHGVPGGPFWAEMLRVAKPGAHLLAFGGTRTVHRIASAIEDAGWEIRDMLVWAYASGFPKSLDVSKAIDKAAGAERVLAHPGAAAAWQGWGTALKPAWEPIVMARKPLRGTVAANVLAHGTGALNIDGTRIGTGGQLQWAQPRDMGYHGGSDAGPVAAEPNGVGRWPANVILTDPIFDGGIEGVVGGGEQSNQQARSDPDGRTGDSMFGNAHRGRDYLGDSGTYSRFFLIPKADRTEREPVVGGTIIPKRPPSSSSGEQSPGTFQSQPTPPRENVHPTVKPLELMRHLVRLVTPPGGTVLDPFLGSGTTGIACEMEGFDWIGIEKEAEYVAIAEARLIGVQRGLGLDVA